MGRYNIGHEMRHEGDEVMTDIFLDKTEDRRQRRGEDRGDKEIREV